MNGRPVLRRLRRALDRNAPVPADVSAWVAHALMEFENGQRADIALGLRLTEEDRAARDEHIARAAEMMPSRLSVAACIAMMHKSVRGLEAMTLERGAVEHLGETWQGEILKALRYGDLPGHRRLHSICSLSRIAKSYS